MKYIALLFVLFVSGCSFLEKYTSIEKTPTLPPPVFQMPEPIALDPIQINPYNNKTLKELLNDADSKNIEIIMYSMDANSLIALDNNLSKISQYIEILKIKINSYKDIVENRYKNSLNSVEAQK